MQRCDCNEVYSSKGMFQLKIPVGLLQLRHQSSLQHGLAYSVGQTPKEQQTLRAKQETVKGCAQERKKLI